MSENEKKKLLEIKDLKGNPAQRKNNQKDEKGV